MDQCHIDPVYKTIWINAKAGTEFFTASTDGMVSYIIFKISTFPFVETLRQSILLAQLLCMFARYHFNIWMVWGGNVLSTVVATEMIEYNERWNWLYASLTLYFVCQKHAITFHESISIIYIYIWIAILIALFSLSNVMETNKKDLGNVIVVCGRHFFLFSRQKLNYIEKPRRYMRYI